MVILKKPKYTEKEMIDGCIRNERHFQEYLYRLYFGKMMGMCMRYTSDREEAMTIVNNGFLRVFKKIELFSFKGSFEGWVRRLVYHSLSDHFRQNSKYVHFLEIEDRDAPTRDETLSNLYLEDLLKLVEALPPATKQVFQLYVLEGYTHVEIAKKISISEGTSKWHLAAARKKLKSMILQNKEMRNYAG